ncbi:MAG TPA: hypothetical protein VF541_19375 [Longimicrobium sp.]
MERTTHRILFGLAVACLAAAAPVKATPAGGLALNTACAQAEDTGSGTCCPEPSSVCFVDGRTFNNYYYKESGSCRSWP